MTFDGSDRKQVRQKEKEAELAEKNRLAYTRQIMADKFGRAWMHQLLFKCHIWSTSFAAGQADVTAFRLGEQNIGLQIFSDVVSASPQEYVLMMQEASQKDQVHDRRYSDKRTTADQQPGSADSGRDAEGPITEYDPYAGEDGVDGA